MGCQRDISGMKIAGIASIKDSDTVSTKNMYKNVLSLLQTVNNSVCSTEATSSMPR